jgi:RNA polymerase sigma-70 factor (family 1)
MIAYQVAGIQNDQDILEKIRSGDKNAFEIFYKQYYKRLYAVAFQYTKHHEQSEEIIHDIFLKIWNNASNLQIGHSLNSYLYRSVINTSINHINREKKKAEKQEKFIVDFDESEIIDDSAEKLENRLNLIEHALDQLPTQCKKVMMMSKFNKCKQQEIADTLNISIKTVKNHLTYGYKKIKDFLNDNNAFLLFLFFIYLYRTL